MQCNVCNGTFLLKTGLKTHILSVHEGVKPFKCEICGLCVSQKGALNKHISVVHDGIKPTRPKPERKERFECNICNKIFAWKLSLTCLLGEKEARRPTPKWNTRFFLAFSMRA